MKLTAVLIAALATFTAAAPPVVKKCTPGTYACTPDSKGWQVCNVDHTWVVSILVHLSVESDSLTANLVCRCLPSEGRLPFQQGQRLAVLCPSRFPLLMTGLSHSDVLI